MQPFKYSGKEIETRHGIDWYDFGARRYDHDIARWTTMDPLSEKYDSVSPYAFCNNNPVNFVDPDGKRWVNKNGQVVYDACLVLMLEDVGNVISAL